MTNDFIEEMKKLGFDVNIKSEEVILSKNGKESVFTLSKIRRIFINSLVSHIDNNT
jgi:hypothetical protein